MNEEIVEEKVQRPPVAPPFILLGVLHRFNNSYQAKADAHFKELTWKQMFLLNSITLFDEAPTIKDIADFIGSSHQNANKLYSKLLAGGYITSVHDPVDRRKQRISITEKGKKFLEANQFGNAKYVFDIFKNVSDEEINLVIDVISRLTARMEEMGTESEDE